MSATPPCDEPLAPPLRDAQGRVMSYLRLSLTDRCNFRCVYCSPASWGGRGHLLDEGQLGRLVGCGLVVYALASGDHPRSLLLVAALCEGTFIVLFSAAEITA